MSRRGWLAMASITAFLHPNAVFARDSDGVGPPERIDLTITQSVDDEPLEDCSDEQEAATISGEIIVCRQRRSGREFGFDKDRAEQRYAEETMDKGDPRTPDFTPQYPGVVVARGCFIPPCPPPKALLIDIEALPEAPPGSDAARVAQGLAPRGDEAPQGSTVNQSDLGLPPLPQPDGFSPSESASLAEEPPG